MRVMGTLPSPSSALPVPVQRCLIVAECECDGSPTGSTGYGQELCDAIKNNWGGSPFQVTFFSFLPWLWV